LIDSKQFHAGKLFSFGFAWTFLSPPPIFLLNPPLQRRIVFSDASLAVACSRYYIFLSSWSTAVSSFFVTLPFAAASSRRRNRSPLWYSDDGCCTGTSSCDGSAAAHSNLHMIVKLFSRQGSEILGTIDTECCVLKILFIIYSALSYRS